MRLDMIRKTSLLRKINPMMRRSSFTNKDIYNSIVWQLASHNDRAPKRPGDSDCDPLAMLCKIFSCGTLRRSQTRIDLLFTMSEIPHAHP